MEFERGTDETSRVDITWQVVTYPCGVTVQRGVATGTGAPTLDTAIAPVDPQASFVVAASVPVAGDTTYDAPDPKEDQDYRARLDTAMKLLQCFTADRMHAHGHGRRTFHIWDGKVISHLAP